MATTTTITSTQSAQPSADADLILNSSPGVSISELRIPSFTHRALVVTAGRKYELKPEFKTLAALAPGEVKIRSHAVGLNQIDYKSVDYNMCLPELPWITGREMAGVVEEVGSAVQHVKPGQRVWTSTYYRDRRAGCFQDFVIVPEHTVCEIPAELSFTSASRLGVCGLTAAMTLWRWFGISPIPSSSIPSTDFVLIWGGSSITGQFLIQLASQHGLRVIAVGSAKTAQLLAGRGAEHVVTRNGKSNDMIVEEVKILANDGVTMGIDLVGAQTAVATVQCLSSTRAAQFAPLAWAPKMELPSNVEMLNVEMKQFVLNPESKIHAEQLTRLVGNGQIRLPDIEVLKGGLEVVEEGLERLKRGNMAGKKLVVEMIC